MKRDAIDAVPDKFKDQFYFDLEPASKGAARLACDQLATDATEASIGGYFPPQP
jgi:hypothetical protein